MTPIAELRRLLAAVEKQRDGLRSAARDRVKKGHSDTCSAELGCYPCDCGHVALLDALAAAHPNRTEALSIAPTELTGGKEGGTT